ncbi:MAG: DUF2922 domain-containing protein [Acidaminococcaceae bacterium]|nr:DUF2922 domain-containing protein [Acidaminococcaceae bacterium]
MTNTKNLILVFSTEDNENHKITVTEPKDDLTLETVQAVMQDIIDADALLTAGGKHLDTVVNCYYRYVVEEPLESEDGE